ncbi:hypothetical protein BDN67DRAFT_966382 [Paxillus ammoniavirescens]|nr:hypothetical protein BDN67DRAFT_966382 [Paxillus ammoniavirescens]
MSAPRMEFKEGEVLSAIPPHLRPRHRRARTSRMAHDGSDDVAFEGSSMNMQQQLANLDQHLRTHGQQLKTHGQQLKTHGQQLQTQGQQLQTQGQELNELRVEIRHQHEALQVQLTTHGQELGALRDQLGRIFEQIEAMRGVLRRLTDLFAIPFQHFPLSYFYSAPPSE